LLLRWLLIGAPPVIWHLRDILTARHFSSLNRRIAVTLANTCATNVLVNPMQLAKPCRSWGRKELVRLVYNGFALDAFGDLGQGKATEIRAELELAMLHWWVYSAAYRTGKVSTTKPCANHQVFMPC